MFDILEQTGPHVTDKIQTSPMADAIRSIYGTGSSLVDFIIAHIKELKSSDDGTISKVGDVLAAVKAGFVFGYISPIAVVAVGQLLLGNPLTAAVATVSMAVSPVAISCAAVGAIWLGWGALKPSQKARILETVASGLGFAITGVAAVVEFVVNQAKSLVGSHQMEVLRAMVVNEAESFGRSLSKLPGKTVDSVKGLFKREPVVFQRDDQTLTEVLWHMEREEIMQML